ncbi:unnamed protein product [Ambrosiozyma monospora]|uniref:Unnamed protein product n=1 Tax=Ambrosiozyma monospora TaxID=43982 RepID=A0A9W6SY72_AMBMO|nr:unnamed protein product [Ambrosiozyma monospora]
MKNIPIASSSNSTSTPYNNSNLVNSSSHQQQNELLNSSNFRIRKRPLFTLNTPNSVRLGSSLLNSSHLSNSLTSPNKPNNIDNEEQIPILDFRAIFNKFQEESANSTTDSTTTVSAHGHDLNNNNGHFMAPTVITGFDANGDMSGLKRAFSETEKNQFDPTFGKRYPPQQNYRGGRSSGLTRQHQYQQQRQNEAENHPGLGVLNGDATGGDQYLPSSSINGFQSSQTQISGNANGQLDHSVINNVNGFHNHQRQRSKTINLGNGIEDEYIPGLVSFDFHAWIDEEAVSFDESEPTHQHIPNLPLIPLPNSQQLQPATINAVTVPKRNY